LDIVPGIDIRNSDFVIDLDPFPVIHNAQPKIAFLFQANQDASRSFKIGQGLKKNAPNPFPIQNNRNLGYFAYWAYFAVERIPRSVAFRPLHLTNAEWPRDIYAPTTNPAPVLSSTGLTVVIAVLIGLGGLAFVRRRSHR